MANKSREPAYKRRREAWRELLLSATGDPAGDNLVDERMRLLDKWRADPWEYLTGRDTDGRPILWTADKRDDLVPVKPFPADKAYLKYLTRELWGVNRIFACDKCRQMIVTTTCCCNLDWYASFTLERDIFVSRVTEESAAKMINDMIRDVHYRKPKWLQEACPISEGPYKKITYLDTGSTITAVSQTFADSAGRGPTASLVFIDEAAFQENFRAIYRAVQAYQTRVWAVSTANIGNDGAACFKELIFDGRPGH
ncbi:MAG TPA: hypothetical protein VIV12_16760, partial [Streptosporangiaceae bacterium]